MTPTRTAPAARRLNRLAALLSLGLLLCLLPARGWAQCNQLVWSDDFGQSSLDTTKWKVINGDGCPGLCGFGNAELQNYRPQNVSLVGGNLVISTKFETTTAPSGNSYQYSSGKLESKIAGKGTHQLFKYGRIEARMQLPSAGGIWPAFWMLADPGNWPYTGEIDIMEAKHKNPTSMTGTAIGNAGGGNPYFASRSYSAGIDLSTGFHVYAIEWGPDVLRFYVDNNLYNTVTAQTAPGAFPFNDNQFFLILNAAVGGPGSGYTGNIPPTPADYPTQTLVDYVRVYKGTYNYAVIGDGAVYQNEQFKNYRLDAIVGATYAWTVPAGATIVSGQGTNLITVNWGTTPGNVTATVSVASCPTNTYAKAVTVSPALQLEKVHEDFQTNRFVTYGPATGTLTQAIANPGSAAPNTSTLVGRYVRNPSEQYDVMNVRNLTVANANDFAQGRKKMYVDVYSTAPVGSRVTMQFENSNVTTAINFPLGRHSSYKAFTTRQNAWETLEFDYEQTIDAGTSIFAINNVAFLFEPGLNTANTFYFDNLRTYTQPVPPTVATDVLENYDGTSRISFDPAVTNGTYTAAFANPSATGVNTSSHVGKYVRNSTQTYDVLFFNAGPPGTVITDAGKFKDQTYQLQMDLYTDAPVGTSVRITLQNKVAAAPTGSYPAGRNSTYLAVTTVQNGWQTLTLSFDTAPDAGTSNLAIDQLAVLFNGNTNTGNTYYLDNLKVVKHVADPTYTAGTLFEDYEATHNVSYVTANGTYLATQANPAATGINTSAHVAKYTRNSASTYDALTLASNSVKDGSLFKSGDKVFAMDVYTSAPVGTVVSWQLESSAASLPGNYPSGRHSIYQSVVRQTNTWHTLTFTYASTPDASTTDASVDRLVYLFAPNSTSGDVYYFDNLRSLNKVGTATNAAPTVSLTAPAGGATYTAPASITLTANAADSDGTVSKVEFFNGATLLGTATASPYSYTWTGVAAGTYSLTAKATDNAGATTTSAAASVTVNAAATAQAIPGKIEAESFTTQVGTQTETTTDTGGGLNVDYYETNDYLDYSVNVATAGNYTVGFRVASANGAATLQLRNSGGTVLGSINVGNTGGWQVWQTINATVALPAGVQTLRLFASASTGCNVNWLTFASATNTAPTVSLTSPANGATATAPASITISANAADADGTVAKVDFYQGTTLLNSDTSSPYSYVWTGVAAGAYSITAKATDNGGAVTTSAAVSVTVTPAATGQAIPGKIEAESYSAMLGIQTETTTDTGGGLNVGYIDAADYLDYAVNVATAGTYTVGFRVASLSGGGQAQLRNSAGTTLGSIAIGATGDWQTWQTVSTTVTLTAGAQTLRVYAAAGGWNLNWVSFATASTNTAPTVSLTSPANGSTATAPASITISANAADSDGTISSVAFYQGTTLLNTDTSAPYSYSWTNVAAGTYSITAKATDNAGAVTTSAAASVTVSTSQAGTYCATTTDFSYGAVSSGGNVTFTFHPLGATAGGTLALLYLRAGTTGTYPGYTMTKNAAGDFTYTLALATGTLTNLYFTYQYGAGGPERNTAATPFTYTAGAACTQARGVLATVATATGTVAGAAYPNPVTNQLTVELRGASTHTLTLRDLRGAVVREITAEAGRTSTGFDMTKVASGVYLLTISSAEGTEVRKIMKE